MRILRRHKKAAVKSARGRRRASAPAHLTLSTIGGSLLSLESRIMFDGATVATVSTVTTEQAAESQAEAFFSAEDAATADTAPDAPTGESQPTTSDQALFDALAVYDTSVARQEIVFLSSSVREYQQLLDGISPNVEVIVLDPTRDGVEQMAETLAGRTGIDAVHIISHGSQAELYLGTARLTVESMNGTYADDLTTIGRALTAEADILVYGCNFGQGGLGQIAAMKLTELTGADVAASIDNTGYAPRGGDWELELQTGTIETQLLVGQAAQDQWAHLLVLGITVTPTSSLTTTESGGVDIFTVVLDEAPTADVTIAISSSDTTEETVSTASLTFNTSNWSLPQGVTITGVDDNFVDANVAYTIVTGPAVSVDPVTCPQ